MAAGAGTVGVAGGTVGVGGGSVGSGGGEVAVGAGSVGSGGGEVGVGGGCVAVGRMRVGVEGSAVGWMASGVGSGGAPEPQLLSTVASSVTVASRITHLGIVSLPCLVTPNPVNGAPPHDELESQDRIGYRANRAAQNCGADAMRGPGFLWYHRLPPASTPVFVSRGWARKRWSADPRLPIWAEAVPFCAQTALGCRAGPVSFQRNRGFEVATANLGLSARPRESLFPWGMPLNSG